MTAQPVLELRDIALRYPGLPHPVLQGLDFHAMPGESVAVVGQSGSGKSSLLNLLGLIDKPTSGSRYCDGQDVAELSDRQVSRLRGAFLGFVFQQFLLLDRLTVRDNVAEPLLFTSGVPRREREARALALLAAVGLHDRAHARPPQLSGGEQQRVAIARALVRRPKVVLADEPTGSLDPDTGRAIVALFKRLLRDEGAALVLVTHDHGVAATCDRVLRLEQGRLLPGAA